MTDAEVRGALRRMRGNTPASVVLGLLPASILTAFLLTHPEKGVFEEVLLGLFGAAMIVGTFLRVARSREDAAASAQEARERLRAEIEKQIRQHGEVYPALLRVLLGMTLLLAALLLRSALAGRGLAGDRALHMIAAVGVMIALGIAHRHRILIPWMRGRLAAFDAAAGETATA